MIRPTDEEYKVALEHAETMREQNQDEHFVAKSLLNLDYRIHALEHVLDAAKHYLHSGQAAKEHSVLVLAIEEADKASRYLEDEHHIDDDHDHVL